jgi:hypothetical protein
MMEFRMAHIFLSLVLMSVAAPVFGQIGLLPEKKAHKDDVVILDNGDRLTGEIKKMQHGILHFKSDRAVGTLQLDWERVHFLQSTARYEFEDIRGMRFTGTIRKSVGEQLELELDDASVLAVKLSEILNIREMRRSFFGRVNLTLDAGVTYTQGNQQTQLNIDASMEYAKPLYNLRFDLSSLFSGQKDGATTSRHEFIFFPTRQISPKWDWIGMAALLSDNQQNLDRRSTLGGGVGRTFVETSRTIFKGYSGLVYTRENYSETGEDRNNAEILTGLAISTYKFRSSELEAYLFVFPSISNFGRIRADVDVSWSWEIVGDLYWRVSGFNNFDSDPPIASPNNNFGVTSSIGWSF